MKKALLFVAFGCLLVLAEDVVEITGEPLHHLELQNDFVRVFKVEIPPHGKTLLHRHRHDYFVVALSASNIVSDVQGKGETTIKMSPGEVRFATGNFAHVARNESDAPFPHVDIEILKTFDYKWEEERGMEVLQGGTHEIIFAKDGIRASETELQSHAIIPKQTHKSPHLVIALTDLDLETHADGQTPKHVRLKPGEAAWAEGGVTHTVMNAGHGDAKFVTLEFPPAK